jgi:hypothetical protein
MIGPGSDRSVQAWLVTVIPQEIKDDVARENGWLDAAEERVGFELLEGRFVQPDVELPTGHPRVPSAPQLTCSMLLSSRLRNNSSLGSTGGADKR